MTMFLAPEAPECAGEAASRVGVWNRPGQVIPALDGIRGLAILGVVFSHSIERVADAGLGHWWLVLRQLGACGVDLFFALSGYLITGILIDSKNSAHYFRNFYARRFLRLFPVYYLFLFTTAFLVPLFHRLIHTHMLDYGGNWLWYLLYASNLKAGHGAEDPYLGHFWSLAVEEQFYLLWAPLVMLVSRRGLIATILSAALVSTGVRLCFAYGGADWNTLYRLAYFRLDPLALGALAAVAHRTGRWNQRAARLAWPCAALGIVTFVFCEVRFSRVLAHGLLIRSLGRFFDSVAFAAIVYLTATAASRILTRFFSITPLRVLGKYSYCIYVIHVIIIAHLSWGLARWFGRINPYVADLLCFSLSLAICLLIGAFSWKYFEGPILRLKRHFENGKTSGVHSSSAIPGSPAIGVESTTPG